MLRAIMVSIIIVVTASVAIADDELVGRWVGTGGAEGEAIEFGANGSFSMWNADGVPLIGEDESITLTYEAITVIEPHQLYIIARAEEETERVPFCIYMISDNQLVVRDVITYTRTYGGFSLGVSRYEFPADFNGVITVYRRDNR